VLLSASVAKVKRKHLFQSSPGPEARCYVAVNDFWNHIFVVSILTGPGGPVLPTRAACGTTRKICFNPHRARRPGATWWDGLKDGQHVEVSILTGPGGPVLLTLPS